MICWFDKLSMKIENKKNTAFQIYLEKRCSFCLRRLRKRPICDADIFMRILLVDAYICQHPSLTSSNTSIDIYSVFSEHREEVERGTSETDLR